jgi:hypothetical protein
MNCPITNTPIATAPKARIVINKIASSCDI